MENDIQKIKELQDQINKIKMNNSWIGEIEAGHAKIKKMDSFCFWTIKNGMIKLFEILYDLNVKVSVMTSSETTTDIVEAKNK